MTNTRQTEPPGPQIQGSYDLTLFEEETIGSRIAYTLKRNLILVIGLALLMLIVLFAGLGSTVVDPERKEIGYVKAEKEVADGSIQLRDAPRVRPSWEYWLGSDQFARDIFAYLAHGTLRTLWLGFIAGVISVGIGTFWVLLAVFSADD